MIRALRVPNKLVGVLLGTLSLGLLAVTLSAAPMEGRVSDGHRGLQGVRVYPDRLHHLSPVAELPLAITDAEGRFRLDLEASDKADPNLSEPRPPASTPSPRRAR